MEHVVQVFKAFLEFLLICLTAFMILSQHMRDPAPGASGPEPLPLQFLLLLHCHLLHRRLWRRDAAHLALPAARSHHDLCCSCGASSPGRQVLKPSACCECFLEICLMLASLRS